MPQAFKLRGHLGAHVLATARGGAYRHRKLHVGSVLEHKSGRARNQSRLSEGGAELHGQDDDLCARDALTQPTDRLQAGSVRRVQAQDQHMGHVAVNLSRDSGKLGGLGNQFEICLPIKHEPQAPPDTGMIVGEDDFDEAAGPACGVRVGRNRCELQTWSHALKVGSRQPAVVKGKAWFGSG